ncbi:MAG TPA: response regulator [Anaeromyxobacteraceae bacterium]|nr:response regulator [Anaeromyxobacteraceae bacterium]
MTRPKVLLVDDNQELLALLARLVETEGWVPVAVGKGRTAIDRIGSEKPAAAVVDVLLPDMMGYDVAAALRKAGIPFVFMTGVFKGGRAASDAKGQHGALAYFEKPFEAKKLVEALRSMVPRAPASAASPAPPPPAPPAEDQSDFDVEVAVEAEEPVEAIELTGRVVVEEGGVAAVLSGEKLAAAPVATPSRLVAAVARPPAVRPTPRPRPPPTDLSRPEGRLEENLPELITAFHLAQQTGELTLQKGKVKKTLYFEKGRPCFAISNLVNDRFGPFLVRVGKISLPQLEIVQAAADQSGKRTGEVLVEMGLLKEEEKIYYVAQQVKAIVYSLFGWEEGQYRLHFADRAAGEAVKLDLHPANLIARGVKKLYKPERLLSLLSPDERLVPAPEPAYALHDVELERWEAEMLPRVDGTKTVAELVALARRPEHVVYAFLYAMLSVKLLDRT